MAASLEGGLLHRLQRLLLEVLLQVLPLVVDRRRVEHVDDARLGHLALDAEGDDDLVDDAPVGAAHLLVLLPAGALVGLFGALLVVLGEGRPRDQQRQRDDDRLDCSHCGFSAASFFFSASRLRLRSCFFCSLSYCFCATATYSSTRGSALGPPFKRCSFRYFMARVRRLGLPASSGMPGEGSASR